MVIVAGGCGGLVAAGCLTLFCIRRRRWNKKCGGESEGTGTGLARRDQLGLSHRDSDLSKQIEMNINPFSNRHGPEDNGGPSPQMSSASVGSFLKENDLEEYQAAFTNYGVLEHIDLLELTAEDLVDMGLPKLQQKRFNAAIQRHRAVSYTV
jgi:hypothetical protein